MGVTLSTSTISPLSLTSTIIGFVSFAFTITTWLRVFWNNLNTIFEAEAEIHAYLSNLRIELWEEKQSLRKLRRHNKEFGHSVHGKTKGSAALKLDDVAIRSMQATVKRLIRKLKSIEQPFLDYNSTASRRESPTRLYGRESARWEDDLKGARAGGRGARRRQRDAYEDAHEDYDEDEDWASNNNYCQITLAKRFAWLRRRSDALDLANSLNRLQTRRIARQVGEISVTLYTYGASVDDIRDDVEAMTARLSRIVGIRRVD